MPPSSGKRDESSVTTSPCGTKKNSAASSQSVSALGPALAAVASQRSPSTATRLNNTRSRSPSARSSDGTSSRCVASRSDVPASLTGMRSLLRDRQVADVNVEVVVHAQADEAVPGPELAHRQRGNLLVVDQETDRIGLRCVDGQLVRRLAVRVRLHDRR